ncbi:GATA-type zinc finger protein 1 [Argonauta hians]
MARLSNCLFSDRFLYRKRLNEEENKPVPFPQDRVKEQQSSPLLLTSPFNLPSTPTSIYSSPSPPSSDVKVNRRKSYVPHRSPMRFDPSFRGIVFKFQRKIVNNESHLITKTLFRNLKQKKTLHRRKKTVTYHSDTLSGSEIEHSPKVISKNTRIEPCENPSKVCESCNTRKTPLWRDAEDGTPLCNACGIRYKKYRVRCSKCWHIPKKDDKTYPKCVRCNSMLRFTMGRRN